MFKSLIVCALAACASADFISMIEDEESDLDNMVVVGSWSKSEAEISCALSNLAYCGADMYSNLAFTGYTKGFIVTHSVYNKSKDTEGFIGYLPSDNAIYVSFRGSSSLSNWVTNLHANLVTYKEWSACNCKVHGGFQDAVDAVKSEVLKEVNRLHNKYPTYKIKVTGHSLGGALAQLTGMMLIHHGYTVEMINFGQPRIGDKNYADFANKKFPKQYR